MSTWPDPDGRHVRAVMPAALDAVGLTTTSHGRPGSADRAVLGLPAAPKACVVLVDGLGMQMLLARGGHAPFLRSLLPDALTLTSTFPSTTAAAVTAVGTGELPGRTGMLGYSVRDPADGGLLGLVQWDRTSVSPRAWQRRDTLFEQLGHRRAAGAELPEVVAVGPARFVGSGLTEAALRGLRHASAESLADRVDLTVAQLRRPDVAAVYLYWGEVDHTGHEHGWGSWQWGAAVEELDGELARLARVLPAGTLLLVTADHGMVDVTDRLDVAAVPALAEDVELVAGEPRACHVYTAPGRGAAVAQRWREVLGDRAWVPTREELLATGLLGEVDPALLAAVGDVMAVLTGTSAVLDSRTQPPTSLALVGMHGALTAEEMEVPLLRTVV
ncbi:alkaline phosphatase family protein [Georgenia sp. TF02-10]|uniref:alkaline phosphatase family protein n=1 Tax=Georgenia sp. TF02-10 TaxID=2917725 RepID=UPI001FA6F294|nr:nucleotide pyrophosphatase/phosphodiesterase family protein [Georgenia sp. TF02-10]UNX53387.1 alkaline phosphatase family protein [Georgenia sp. TF02-10]